MWLILFRNNLYPWIAKYTMHTNLFDNEERIAGEKRKKAGEGGERRRIDYLHHQGLQVGIHLHDNKQKWDHPWLF